MARLGNVVVGGTHFDAAARRRGRLSFAAQRGMSAVAGGVRSRSRHVCTGDVEWPAALPRVVRAEACESSRRRQSCRRKSARCPLYRRYCRFALKKLFGHHDVLRSGVALSRRFRCCRPPFAGIDSAACREALPRRGRRVAVLEALVEAEPGRRHRPPWEVVVKGPVLGCPATDGTDADRATTYRSLFTNGWFPGPGAALPSPRRRGERVAPILAKVIYMLRSRTRIACSGLLPGQCEQQDREESTVARRSSKLSHRAQLVRGG